MMNKTRLLISLLAVLLGGMSLASCSDSEEKYHTTYFVPLTSQAVQIYADQRTDTLGVYSTDNWTLSLSDQETMLVPTWMTASPTSHEIASGYNDVMPIVLTLEPNTTGFSRTALVYVKSAYGKIGSVAQAVKQLAVHEMAGTNILLQEPSTSAAYYSVETSLVRLRFSVTSHSAAATLDLSAAADAISAASVTPQGKGIATQGDGLTFLLTKADTYNVDLTLKANETGAARTFDLLLTGNGVTTRLQLTQSAL